MPSPWSSTEPSTEAGPSRRTLKVSPPHRRLLLSSSLACTAVKGPVPDRHNGVGSVRSANSAPQLQSQRLLVEIFREGLHKRLIWSLASYIRTTGRMVLQGCRAAQSELCFTRLHLSTHLQS